MKRTTLYGILLLLAPFLTLQTIAMGFKSTVYFFGGVTLGSFWLFTGMSLILFGHAKFWKMFQE